MRRSWSAVVVLVTGCTPGVASPRPAQDPQVFTGTPVCAYTILGTFSHSQNVLREVSIRGGDAAILVNEESSTIGNDRVSPHIFSGTVVRFTEPGCKGEGSRAPVNGR